MVGLTALPIVPTRDIIWLDVFKGCFSQKPIGIRLTLGNDRVIKHIHI
jgi:hypothetical protein